LQTIEEKEEIMAKIKELEKKNLEILNTENKVKEKQVFIKNFDYFIIKMCSKAKK